ncbi:hypothetical protein SAY86_006444 [Trapa natans]|uniref:Transmembrane protein 18 n=1 Tax=Trapa natans TaxID=22666 RepID=A0AAN7L4J9_TRANT|nr:hypothetical protein SAY86_006444 [Trapa natans]
MEEIQKAFEQHMVQMEDLVQKFSTELRSGLQPAYENFMGFIHAIDWKEPFLMGLLVFHFLLLVTTIISRKNSNFQMCLFLLALGGVYLAEKLNKFLRENWRSFATQNYFDSHGIFLSTLWSGPLLVMAIIILVNTLFNLCYLIVKWKKAELRHKAKLYHNKHD